MGHVDGSLRVATVHRVVGLQSLLHLGRLAVLIDPVGVDLTSKLE